MIKNILVLKRKNISAFSYIICSRLIGLIAQQNNSLQALAVKWKIVNCASFGEYHCQTNLLIVYENLRYSREIHPGSRVEIINYYT